MEEGEALGQLPESEPRGLAARLTGASRTCRARIWGNPRRAPGRRPSSRCSHAGGHTCAGARPRMVGRQASPFAGCFGCARCAGSRRKDVTLKSEPLVARSMTPDLPASAARLAPAGRAGRADAPRSRAGDGHAAPHGALGGRPAARGRHRRCALQPDGLPPVLLLRRSVRRQGRVRWGAADERRVRRDPRDDGDVARGSARGKRSVSRGEADGAVAPSRLTAHLLRASRRSIPHARSKRVTCPRTFVVLPSG